MPLREVFICTTRYENGSPTPENHEQHRATYAEALVDAERKLRAIHADRGFAGPSCHATIEKRLYLDAS